MPGPGDGGSAGGVEIDWLAGPHAQLRPLFELAEDSSVQLDGYLDQGRVLVARSKGGEPIGHLQLVPTARPGEIELKNMAVVPAHRGSGVGRALVEHALARCTGGGWTRMVVATGAADTGNLRFYQRCGFRMETIERDAFTPATGYPEPIVVDGVLLRDRVWLSRELPLSG
jgi:GNAT superfamily N-acetyltransferase